MPEQFIQILLKCLRLLVLIYDIFTFPLYYMIQQPWRKILLSERLKAIEVANDTKMVIWKPIDAHHSIARELKETHINTMAHIMIYCTRKFANRRCLGTRKLISETEEMQPNGKTFAKSEYGDYTWRTMNDVNNESKNFGRGIRQLGVAPEQRVAVFSETRAEWMISALGLFKHSIAIVTVFANLGDEGIVHAINETTIEVIITSYDLLWKLNDLLNDLPYVKTIVYIEPNKDGFQGISKEHFKKVQLHPYKEVLQKGEKALHPEVMPLPETPAIIMYTSGSTGIPKGVVILHSNLVATLLAFCDCTYYFNLAEDDCLLAFLPLAHVYELVVECACLVTGVAIGYSSPFTMIDSSTKIKSGTKGDATILRPTVMTAVPLILDRIAKGIKVKMENRGTFVNEIFKLSVNYKAYWKRRGYTCPILDKILFGKIRKVIGGRMKYILTGGAPLASATQKFVEICLNVKVIQGYGLTETTSGATVSEVFDLTYGRVGAPITTCMIKLENWEDGGYAVTNKPYAQGEIVIGGETVTAGYYKMPEKTKEDFFQKDGVRWFRTGDIGQIEHDGVLRIIDRKKDLVKLQMGEFVSLGKIEMELKTSPLIDNICIIAHPSKTNCVALIVPNEPNLMQFVKTGLRIKNRTFQEVCKMRTVEDAVVDELMNYGLNRRLNKYEIPVAVRLCDEPWTPDNNLVTAAFKIRRREITSRFKHSIGEMYD